jgi:hypothetical protein
MKRGLVEWNPEELSRAALDARRARAQALLAAHDLDAAVCYTSVAYPVLVRYLTHFLPYWNEGVLVLPRGGDPLLLVALSNRVFPWIQASSTLTQIRPSRNFGADAGRYLAERGARRIGVADRGSFPYRVLEALDAALPAGAVVDCPDLTAAIPLADDPDELRLRAHAGRLANAALATLASFDSAPADPTDAQLAGHLDRALRLAGAEDTLVLVGPPGRWPGLPTRTPLPDRASILIQAEYKGHWVQLARTLPLSSAPPSPRPSPPSIGGGEGGAWRLCTPGRPVADLLAEARAHHNADLYLHRAAWGAPFAALDDTATLAEGDIIALLALDHADGTLHGDTLALHPTGPHPLT